MSQRVKKELLKACSLLSLKQWITRVIDAYLNAKFQINLFRSGNVLPNRFSGNKSWRVVDQMRFRLKMKMAKYDLLLGMKMPSSDDWFRFDCDSQRELSVAKAIEEMTSGSNRMMESRCRWCWSNGRPRVKWTWSDCHTTWCCRRMALRWALVEAEW